MHVGIMIEAQEGLTWDRWSRLIEAAEGLGYESLCRSDHLTGLNGQSRRPSLDTWTSLTVVAERTKRIRFGPMVSPMTFYHPAILTKMAVALDTLSGGRLDLGIGAGWNEHEHAMFGVPMPPLKERLDRLEAGARHIRALGAGQPVTLEQRYYPLLKAEVYPLPTHGRLRLVVGGRGEKRTLRIVAEFADEWNMTRVDIPGFEQKLEVLGRHCADVGRDPNTIRRSLMIPMVIGRDRAEVARRIAAARAIFPSPARGRGWVARGQLPRRLGLGDRRRARPVGRGGDGARAAADDGPGGHRRAGELRARRPAQPILVMFSALLTADGLIALVTLTAMEIVLGIDNVVFLAILVGRLPGGAGSHWRGGWGSRSPSASASASSSRSPGSWGSPRRSSRCSAEMSRGGT